jgi:Zn-dependent protease with chaperone function
MVIETSQRYEQISPKAYEHPADKAATSALHSVPFLDTLIKKLVDMGYERRVRQRAIASSIRLGPEQLPETWNYYIQAATILDMPYVPELFVQQHVHMNAMTIGANQPIVLLNSGIVASLSPDELQTVMAHEASHVLSEHVYYTTAMEILALIIASRVVKSTPLGLPVGLPLTGLYLALLEWHRAAELSADRAAALVRGDPLDVCRLLMRMAGGGVPGLNFDAFMKQCSEYHSEEGFFNRHSRFLAEIQLTHPVVVRRVKELTEWVQSGEYDRIRAGNYPRRGQEPPPSAEFEAAVESYRAKFANFLDRTANDVQRVGRQVGDWIKSRATGTTGDGDDDDMEDE